MTTAQEREKKAALMRRWSSEQKTKDPEGWRERRRVIEQRYAANNHKKIAVRQRVCRAVKSGRLVRPTRCESCNQVKDVFAHHHDYDKPLDVEWLCRQCHMTEHFGEAN